MIRRLWRAAACALSVCTLVAGWPAAAQTAPVAQVWMTSADAGRRLERQADLPSPAPAGPDAEQIEVDADRPRQKIVGFGAAISDASAHLLQSGLAPEARRALYAELFSTQGIGLSFVRVPIGASDFSQHHYSLNDVPPGKSDPRLRKFSLAPALTEQIPALRAALAANPGLTIMASPWSAPAWMKDSRSLIKGRLRPDAYAPFAAYLTRYVREMAKVGVPIHYLSVQNEPDFEPADYPGMRFDPGARARFVGVHLGPMLARRHPEVRILDYDHNWDRPQDPLATLADPAASRYISGVAWHCYGGEVEAMSAVTATYPDKDSFITECSGGDWAPDWGGTLGWMIDKLIITPSRLGSRGTLLWNLALDENHGPHLGGCGNCRAVVTIDSKTGAITRNVEYYVLAHASRFVRPGARRIESTPGRLTRNAVFRNQDGSRVALLYNPGKEPVQASLRDGASRFTVTLPGGEVATLVWGGG